MPAGSSDSTAAPDHSLSPAERERRAQTWARVSGVFHILLGCGALFALAIGASQLLLDTDSFKHIIPIGSGLLIVYMALLLTLLTLLVRNRPSWPTTIWGMRILLGATYALFLPVIGGLLLLMLSSLGVPFNVGVITSIVGFAAAFFVTMDERRLQQMEEDRATLPRPW
jgi:hypothetical protein